VLARADHALALVRPLTAVDHGHIEVVGERRREVDEHVRAVSAGEDEAPEALVGEDPDHVQQDRIAGHLHERLRDLQRVRICARAAPAAEDQGGGRSVHRVSRV
jgi:hypothetical protein